MVCFNLSVHVVCVDGEGAHVLVHLFDGYQRLHHGRSLVQHVLPYRHRLPRCLLRRLAFRYLITGSHLERRNPSALTEDLELARLKVSLIVIAMKRGETDRE